MLAAGRSERLGMLTGGRSKALVHLGGVPLVERTVRRLLGLGLERVVVVVGHQGDAVESALDVFSRSRVEVVHAPGWEAGNGASLAGAEEAVQGEPLFLLVCGDHMFSDGALDELVRAGEPAVLVDRSPSAEAWAEGTRVHLRRGQAIAFSKDLDDPSIDCGAFLLPAEVFESQRRAAEEGDHSLAGAVTRLARAGGVRAVPLQPGTSWQDVDTPEDLRSARILLRRSLGKPSDGFVSRHLNRPISSRITMTLSPFRIHPNVFSMLTLMVGLWAAWSLSASRPEVGALFAQLASVLDGVDGETARLHYRTSRFGSLLDDFVDRAVDAAIVAGLCLWVWDNPGRLFRAGIILSSVVGLMVIHALVKESTARLEMPKTAERPFGVLLGARDSRMFLLALGALAELPFAALAAGTAAYIISVLRRFPIAWRQWRLSRAQPAAPGQVSEPPDRDLYEVG